MPLSYNDQLNLLKDILQNHLEDCCGSVSELEQIERLVKSLMVNENVHADVKNILNEVYNYGQNGKYTSDLDTHIESHQNVLSQWVDSIGQFS